jgi:hypothetical protein
VLAARRAAGFAEAWFELDDGLDRSAGGGQAADQQAGGQELSGDVGDHALGQGELPVRRLPSGFERGGVGSVTPGGDVGGGGRSHAERAGVRAIPTGVIALVW